MQPAYGQGVYTANNGQMNNYAGQPPPGPYGGNGNPYDPSNPYNPGPPRPGAPATDPFAAARPQHAVTSTGPPSSAMGPPPTDPFGHAMPQQSTTPPSRSTNMGMDPFAQQFGGNVPPPPPTTRDTVSAANNAFAMQPPPVSRATGGSVGTTMMPPEQNPFGGSGGVPPMAGNNSAAMAGPPMLRSTMMETGQVYEQQQQMQQGSSFDGSNDSTYMAQGGSGLASAAPVPRMPGVLGATPGRNSFSTQYQHVPGAAITKREQWIKEVLEECEQFNSGPHFVRPTLSRLPQSVSAKNKAHVPMGVIFQPMADVPHGYPEVPTVQPVMYHPRGMALVRCKAPCRTYVNPFVRWTDNGSKWICNVCGTANETPTSYQAPLDEKGNRTDMYDRPELSHGACEYTATEEYMTRAPQPPVVLFLIEVTQQARESGLLHETLQGIRNVITSGEMVGTERLQCGIMTFDSSLHFYNLDPNLATPQLVVVADIDDIFIPIADDVLLPLAENQDALLNLLDQIPVLWKDNKTNESCLHSAIRGAFMAMKHMGGKMCVFASQIPTAGEGALMKSRDDRSVLMTDREVEFLQPAMYNYKGLGMDMTQSQICCDLFMGTQAFVDLATISALPKVTGGTVQYYENFHPLRDGTRLKNEIFDLLTKDCCWESVMRVRMSRGWKITKLLGNMLVRGTERSVPLPNVSKDSTFGIAIDMEENVSPDPVAAVQIALLFTNSDGERRIRVHTYQFLTSNNHKDVMESLDSQACAAMMMTLGMERALNTSLQEARQLITQTCQQIVQACLGLAGAEQHMKFLPMYVLGLLKTEAFKGTNNVPFDRRVAAWMRLATLPVNGHVVYYYPRLMKVSALTGEEGLLSCPEEEGLEPEIAMPPMMNLTQTNITQEHAYIIENGESMYMWIGALVNKAWLQNVFNVAELGHLNPNLSEAELLADNNTEEQRRVKGVISGIRKERIPSATGTFMLLNVIRQGDPLEQKFQDMLVEDARAGIAFSYQDFVQRMSKPTFGM